ncbi:MAG: tetratricopeptide repeat protein [Verrucomicrobia bacterium]|nr:tetratricopeptide repeat protein [Verrucomicrobiota bacterium]
MFINILMGAGLLGFFGWLAWKIAKASIAKTEEPAALFLKWCITIVLIATWVFALSKLLKTGPGVVIMVPITVFIFFILGVLWTPTLAKTMLNPLTNAFDGGNIEPDPTPFYAVAEAKRKRGLYDISISEVRKQLAKFPNDLTGHLMLSELLSEHKDDVDGAIELLEQYFAESEPGPVNGAFVLNRLADLQLKFKKDPEKARAYVKRIHSEFPDSEQGEKALLRIAHLQDEDFLTTRHEAKTFTVKKSNLKLGLSDDPNAVQAPVEDIDAKAHQMVAHLEQHPNDTDVREQLAWIYADHYRKIDWAIDQLKQLTQMEHQSVSKMARWYNQIADVYCRYTGSSEAARYALEEFIQRFPGSGHSERARTRLKRLKLEAKTSKKSQSMETGPSLQKMDFD